MLLQLQMEIKCSQKSGFSGDRILKHSLVPGKKESKAGRSDCWFDFEILATLIEYFQMFSSLTMPRKKFNIADHYRLA